MFREQKRYGNNPESITRAGNQTFYQPLKWLEPRKIFTCSWSDFFIPEADQWRREAWTIIRHTPQYTYQILTKRPERIMDVAMPEFEERMHCWFGVSVENRRFYRRIQHLTSANVAMRFLSIEPL